MNTSPCATGAVPGPGPRREKPLNRDAVKAIAMLCMLLNHIALIFLPSGTWTCEVFTAVGYFTAISMLYFLVEGYSFTRSKKKYFLRLFLFGLLSEVPYCLAMTEEGAISFCGLNMMFTLALCFGLIWAVERTKSAAAKVFLAAAAVILSIFCDWAVLAPVYTLLFLWAKENAQRERIAFAVSVLLFGGVNLLGGLDRFPMGKNILYALLDMAGMGLAALCILFCYNGQRARGGSKLFQWFFYAFYPAHLLILGLIRIWSA